MTGTLSKLRILNKESPFFFFFFFSRTFPPLLCCSSPIIFFLHERKIPTKKLQLVYDEAN